MFTAGVCGPLKRILLLRHAKAEPADGFASDHDRSLAERGRRAATALGPVIAAAAWAPDEVFCSTARRTRETWQQVAAAGALLVMPVSFRPELYEASVGRVLDVIADAGAESGSVLVVGHEPTMSGTLRTLTGRLTGSFPTGALAVLRFDHASSWAECVPGEGFLEVWIES